MPRPAASPENPAHGAPRHSWLAARWHALCAALNCPQQAAGDIWRLIERHYGEPHRHYHHFEHVAALLRHADAHRAHVCEPCVMELAIWFHDIVYDTRTGGNEVTSAALATAAMQAMQADSVVIAQVERCILATIDHAVADAQVADLPLFLDFDLSILGASADIYLHYRDAIRREYEWVPEPDYRAGRARVLRRFLERPALYFTPWMSARFEQPARDNIQTELLLLERETSPGNS